MPEPTLQFLGSQIERVLHEIADIKDSISVLTAMAIRHETSIQTVVIELQAIHRHNARTHDRLLKLEGAEPNG